jgi:transposase
MSPLFDEMYSSTGRPSIAPEMLLKAQLLMALYSVPSERQLCEQLRYNLLFRWFLDMDMVSAPFDVTVFTKNRDRLLRHRACEAFFQKVVEQARAEQLLSRDHFSVDGTLIEAWASLKSFTPKGDDEKRDDDDDPGAPRPSGNAKQRRKQRRSRNSWKDFKGKKRSNQTHRSTTDPEARLMRKGGGQEAKLCYSLHGLMENRSGLLADLRVDLATGTAERDTAEEMLRAIPGGHRVTVGADRGYDTRAFVATCRELGVTPHVAQNVSGNRSSAIDDRTTRHGSYKCSQKSRMFIESIFGWMKTRGGIRRTRFKGRARTQMHAHIVGAAYNLLRMSRLAPV